MNHRPGSNGEILIRILHQHWIKYVLPSFIYITLVAISMLLFLLAGMTAHHSPWLSVISFIAALLLFSFIHHWFFLVLLCESTTHIIITNYRVILMRERIFLDENMLEFAFEKMKVVEAKKHGILQTVLRYGSVNFEGGAGIPLVPHPNSVAKDIEQAIGMR
jgi:hypothetical protein